MTSIVAPGFEPVARQFQDNLRDEHGAALCIYHRGECVVDLWGGVADVKLARPWTRDTRIVVFSVTKGLVAMAFTMIADRFEWDAPVATYWPGFDPRITVRMIANHRAGLVAFDGMSFEQYVSGASIDLAKQRTLWTPGEAQGYHAVTYGVYMRELFERIAGESIGAFLTRMFGIEIDVSLGTIASIDDRIATLYPTGDRARNLHMLGSLVRPSSAEARILRALVRRGSPTRRAFEALRTNLDDYNSRRARRAELAWASATASANGLARAYLPFRDKPELHARESWSERDLVLQKPIGWTRGFLKEETHLFSPNRESFGHAGLGGSLGWCDPVADLTIGYVVNRLDWRVRSPRAIALCRALYACEPIASAVRSAAGSSIDTSIRET